MDQWIFITIGLLLLMSAFFSGMEIAYVTSNKLKLELDKKENNFSSKFLRKIADKPAEFITTMLVGNNIALVLYGIYTGKLITNIIHRYYPGMGDFTGLIIQTVVSGFIILLLAEFLPKIVFQIYSNTFLKVFALPTYFIYLLLRPVSWIVIKISDFIIRLFAGKQDENFEISLSKSELRKYLDKQIQEESSEVKTEPEMEIFTNALEFSDVKVREIMVPRTDILALDIHAEPEELQKLFKQSGHSKILAYDGNIDHIVGYFHFYDLFKKPRKLKDILRKVLMVPETMSVMDLLKLMNKKKKSIAVVFDEYGVTSGLVTLEDIMEKIFGDIEDEHDKEELTEKQLDENTYLFSAKLNVKEINDKYRLHLPENEDFESLGGYVLELFGRIPQTGDSAEDEEYIYTITRGSDKHVEEIKLKKK